MRSAAARSPLAGQTGGAERAGCFTGAGGVDDGLRDDVALAVGTDDSHEERRRGSLSVLHQIVVDARDGDDAGVELDVRRQFGQRGKRLEVALHEVVPCRIRIAIGPHPAAALEKRRRSRVDVVPPRREHADVSPLANAGSGARPGFEDERDQRTREHVGRGGEADGPCSNDDDGQLLL